MLGGNLGSLLYGDVSVMFVTDKVPKAITQKALMQELQFLNSACHLILVHICMKIPEDSLKTFQVVERT